MFHRVVSRQNALLASASVFAFAAAGAARANPTDPTVVFGDVGISGLGSALVVVDSASMRAIVDWQSFSIGAGETTQINQLGSNAAILNRVTGSNLTEIYGSLTSNGQVYLINERGVIVGADGVIDTSGFVASTLDVTDADFIGAGNMVFGASGAGEGTITVLGKIRSVSGGDVFLLSREIEIGAGAEVTGGYVGLAAGEEILLRPVDSGEGRVSIRAGKGRITNKGDVAAVVADLRAAGGNEYALAINNEGVVRATGASTSGGRVMLTAGGAVANSGKIAARKEVVVRSTKAIANSGSVTASDADARTGGTIIFEAPEITIQAGSVLDVSGALGGGRAFVGGGYQGKGTDHAGNAVATGQNAQTVTVEAGAKIDASSSAGSGGEVVVWADGTTSFKGDIIASSGAGKGGMAEVSGKSHLLFDGSANLIGRTGFGTLLLDPGTVRIVTGSGGVGVDTFTAGRIESQLQLSNVIISTANASGTNGSEGDIVIEQGVSIAWTNTLNANSSLILRAGRDIFAASDVEIQNYGSSVDGESLGSDAGGVFLYAGRDVLLGSGTGDRVVVGSEFGKTVVKAGVSLGGTEVDQTGSVILTGSNDVSSGYVQIGFVPYDGRNGAVNNGTITVEAGKDVVLTGGNAGVAYAQIGHGGYNFSGSAQRISGNINVTSGLFETGDVVLNAAAMAGPGDYVQIGHGSVGLQAQGDLAGRIMVNAYHDGNVLVGTTFQSDYRFGQTMQVTQIGHGGHLVNNPFLPDDTSLSSGDISGAIYVYSWTGAFDSDEVSTIGRVQVGSSLTAAEAGDDFYFNVAKIGHGATTLVQSQPGADAAEFNVTYGATSGEIVVIAGSVPVIASESPANYVPDWGLAVQNSLLSQIGSGQVTFALPPRGDKDNAADSIRVVEGDLLGNIYVRAYGSEGVAVTGQIAAADENVVSDAVFARIGHGGHAVLTTGTGGDGYSAGSIDFTQANVIGSQIYVSSAAADSAIAVTSSVEAGMGAVVFNRVGATIGSGGTAIFLTGSGPDSLTTQGGNGGDIVFRKGTVWDGNRPMGDVLSNYSPNDPSISLESAGTIEIGATVTAGQALAAVNVARASVGHGSFIELTTGSGGSSLPDAAFVGAGGRGGDVTIIQQSVPRDYGYGSASADDDARGLRGDISLIAHKADGVAVSLDSSVAAGIEAAFSSQASALVGHGDMITVLTGSGGNGGSSTNFLTSFEDTQDAFAFVTQELYGGRGGNIDIRLNRTDVDDQANITMLIEGSIYVETPGTLQLNSAVKNGVSVASSASAQSVIGHTMLVSALSGDGGTGGGAEVGASGTLQGTLWGTVYDSEYDAEQFMSGSAGYGSNRGGNGGDVRVLLGDITGRSEQGDRLVHVTDASGAGQGANITLAVGGAEVSDGLVLTTKVDGGLVEGTGADVASLVGHNYRVLAVGGRGGDGGSTNTQFDNDPNSLVVGATYLPNETAGVVLLQPNASGGRGGDVFVASGNMLGDIVVSSQSRVTVETTAAHGGQGQAAAQIGHSSNMLVFSQSGGAGGSLYEPAPGWDQATYDGGIKNASFPHVLVDGNADDEFDLTRSELGVDGIAVTAADIAARRASSFASIQSDPDMSASVAGLTPAQATRGVILHDQKADPQYILGYDGTNWVFMPNTAANNAAWANNEVNLERFGRLVGSFDGYNPDRANVAGVGPVFVDLDRDGAVDLVDLNRDGYFDIIDVDGDGVMDQIDGRANFVSSQTRTVNNITGLGVLDYVAVTNRGLDTQSPTGGWALDRQLRTTDLSAAYIGFFGGFETALVGDFSTANGGRGGDAYALSGYLSGDISISTAVNKDGAAASLVVRTNLTDDVTAGSGSDYQRAVIGHAAVTVADAAATFSAYQSGIGALVGIEAATGGDAGNYAINASGGRGGNAIVVQGAMRDNNPDPILVSQTEDFLVGRIWINAVNPLDSRASISAGQVEVSSLVDSDYGGNFSLAQLGHFGMGFAAGGSGGNGASKGSQTGPSNGSQTEIADGGAGGVGTVRQHHIRGDLVVMAGANPEDQSVSLKLTAENGAGDVPTGSGNYVLASLGHSRLAAAYGGNGGTGDDGQARGNGGAGGGAAVDQAEIRNSNITVRMIDPIYGYYGNGMVVSATDLEGSFDTVRAQVGASDLGYAYGGRGGDGSRDYEVLEQLNQTANGGAGGSASVGQWGYSGDIRLDIGANATGGDALLVSTNQNSIKNGVGDHTLALIGHGGLAQAQGGAGGAGGLSGAIDGINSGVAKNYLDSDFNYTDFGPYAVGSPIDPTNRITLGTSREGGAGGYSEVFAGGGVYGNIFITTNDLVGVRQDGRGLGVEAGYDGITVQAMGGSGAPLSVLGVNAALIGHAVFGMSVGGQGGAGITGDLSGVITSGNGGDGGAGVAYVGELLGDITITNVWLNEAYSAALAADQSGTDQDTNISFLALGGGAVESVQNTVIARAGHFSQISAAGGAGGNASAEAGNSPSFTATVSAQGGKGGNAQTGQGYMAGSITVTAENSVIVSANANNGDARSATYAGIGHYQSTQVEGGAGGMGGTVGDQNLYFVYEALREFAARGGFYDSSDLLMSDFERSLIAPVLDYFKERSNDLAAFLQAMFGESAVEIARNARDDDFVGGTDYSLSSLTSDARLGGDDAASTLKHILAASGHGGMANAWQSGVISGSISLTALGGDLGDAARGYVQIAQGTTSQGGAAITQLGHVAEVRSAIGGAGGNLTGGNAGANGIGGDGGSVLIYQSDLVGDIMVTSGHKITIKATDSGSGDYQAASFVGHRQLVGADIVAQRAEVAALGGAGGQETSGTFDDGLNGNGGNVSIIQLGTVSGYYTGVTTDIQLVALSDADDGLGIDIESSAVAVGKPDVQVAIGHQNFIASVKAGDAGRMAALHGPSSGGFDLLEGNGGDISINLTDMGADIDIIARDAVSIRALATAPGTDSARVVIGHQRTVGASADAESEQQGQVTAGMGGDSLVLGRIGMEQRDGDSGTISILLGLLGDSADEGERLVTITSLTEDVKIHAEANLGTARVEIGNQQYVTATTQEAGNMRPVPFEQTAGDSGYVRISRGGISGDILIQTLDSDRESSLKPTDGKQVSITTLATQGNAQVQIGHETTYMVNTGRSGFGASTSALEKALEQFAQPDALPTGPAAPVPPTTFADARIAVQNMEAILDAMSDALRYSGRLPTNDFVDEPVGSDLGNPDAGEVEALYNRAKQAYDQAKAALGSEDSVDTVVQSVIDSARTFTLALADFRTVWETIPQAEDVVAVYADAGSISYGREESGISGKIEILSGRYDGQLPELIVGDDSVKATVFSGTEADDLDDNVVKITAQSVGGTALTEIGHRLFMSNTTGKGGGDTNAAPEEGGIAGDGGSIAVTNSMRGDVVIRAEEVVLSSGAAPDGVAELHLGHSFWLQNLAGSSDIGSLMGAGGAVESFSSVSGDVIVTADHIASAVDAGDRTMLVSAATGGALAFLQMGHQASEYHLSASDPIEPAGLGDGKANKGSNRGGVVSTEQTVQGDVTITLAENRDLIVLADGLGAAQIRLGHGGQGFPSGSGEGSEIGQSVLQIANSGAYDSDDGDNVFTAQSVSGDVILSGTEDLAFRTGLGGGEITVGHSAAQEAVSGQTNAAAGTVPAFGKAARALQIVTGDLTFAPSSSFEASTPATSSAAIRIGHEAQQTAFSADDGGEPTTLDTTSTWPAAFSVNGSFSFPDVDATQNVQGRISIETGEILLSNMSSAQMQLGHLVAQRAAADGDGVAVDTGVGTNNFVANPFKGLGTGYVRASSIIGMADISLSANGASGQQDDTLVATNGTQGDITLTQADGTGGIQVGHRLIAQTSDLTPGFVAPAFYYTLQQIGVEGADSSRNAIQRDGSTLGSAKIDLYAVQDIEILATGAATVQVGHYIEQSGVDYSVTSPVAVNPNSDDVVADSLAAEDSLLRQIVVADISVVAGNDLVMSSKSGTALVGHASAANNQSQVEGNRSVTQQLLKGNIFVEAGGDAGIDAPNGQVAGAGDEIGLGDDILLDASAGGTVRIGHNAPAIGPSPLNATQKIVGDIWVKAYGDLHVLKAAIGHATYDFGSSAVSANNATPEGLLTGTRDRIAGNTTIGAGQNSPAQDSTRVANVLVLDAAKINSGYGGIGNKDMGGKLRIFLPAQEGLTITAGTVFNDSMSNGDVVGVRSGSPLNVFASNGGVSHEHQFELMSTLAAYSDSYIGLGNFAFYFEQPQTKTPPDVPVTIYTPSSGRFTAFSVRGSGPGGAMNTGNLDSGALAGTDSTDQEDCERDENGVCLIGSYQGVNANATFIEDEVVPGSGPETGGGTTVSTMGEPAPKLPLGVLGRTFRSLFGGKA